MMRDLDHGPFFIRVGRSSASESKAAIREACADLDPDAACFVLAFIPHTLDLDEVMRELGERLGGVPVFGCTTAGQITANGYEADALLLMGFPKANFRCSSILFKDLNPLNTTEIATQAQRQTEKFRHTAGWNRLALMFSDGLSKQEDVLVSTLETVLDDLPIFGGSAGDGLEFEKTFVLHKGQAHTNAAVLLLIETNLQFQGVGFDHFLPVGSPLIITDADPDERLVYEINGAPAALEYARLVGCPVDALSPQVFAENPMLLRHNLNYYVRAIRDATEGHALSFLAAIDDGLILTLGRGKEILETLDTGLDVRDRVGRAPDFILGFDCVLRKLEIEQNQLSSKVSDILQARRVLGFNTYGEQQSGVHMNQTFVGVAFFEPETRVLT
ncbi:FIST N-terminal domain-containing protein [Ruegeria hyattellae]|uniref:FIST N-terminal domain-containing protein n=1 Tax=Ruegeria hyattellae TaxID=3233337 RepID=UPI00355B91D3